MLAGAAVACKYPALSMTVAPLTLLVAVVSNRDIGWGDPVAAALAALTAADARGLPATVHEAKAANSAAWADYYSKSEVSLPHSPLTETFFWATLSCDIAH